MKHRKTAATPNGSGFARIQRHGSPQKKYPTLLGAFPFGLILLMAFACCAISQLKAAESDRVEIGEVSAFGGDAEIKHAVAGIGGGLQIGSAIYVGDVITTEDDGSVEIVLGINVRIRLGENTAIKITNQHLEDKMKSGIERKSRRVEISLRYGEMRVRVRENLVTPAPVTVYAANLRVDLPRSDMIISRPKLEHEGRDDFLDVALAWGRAVMNARVSGEKEWNKEIALKVVAPGVVAVPVEPAADYILKWKRDNTAQKAQDAVEKLPFSIDAIKQAPKDIPVQSPQMRGAWLGLMDKDRG